MTVEEIKNGHGLTIAIQTEYQVFLELLVRTIDYCSESQPRKLNHKGEAGMKRLQELLSSGTNNYMIFPSKSFENSESVSDTLMAVWAGLFFYPELSKDRFLVYAEGAALMGDLLEGGWFA